MEHLKNIERSPRIFLLSFWELIINENKYQPKTTKTHYNIMRLGLLIISLTILLAIGNVLFKITKSHMSNYNQETQFFLSIFKNWYWILAMGLSFFVAAILWMYILKHFEVSKAYPLTSLSYIFGMILAAILFKEKITASQWIGSGLIITGCLLIFSY